MPSPRMGLGMGLGMERLTGFTPAAVANLFTWLRADLGIVLNGANVATWQDQSGNGHDVTAAGIAQPLYVASGGPNGVPYIEFDGVNEYLQGTWVANQPQTRITVLVPSVSNNSGTVYFVAGSGSQSYIYDTSAAITWLRMFAGVLLNYGAITYTAWQYITHVFNGASSSLAVNSGAAITGNAGSNALGGLTLAANHSGGGMTDCRIAEHIEYSGTVSAGDLALLQAYMADRYGL